MREKESAAGRRPAAVLGLDVSTLAHAPSVPRNGRSCQAHPQPKPWQAIPTEREMWPAQPPADAPAGAARQARQQADLCLQQAEACAAVGDKDGRWAWLRQRQLHLAEVWTASRQTGQDAGRRPAEECVLC